MAIPDKFLKPYNPQETESRIYAAWEKSGLFNPDTSISLGLTNPDAPVFSIVLPPPNVTGTLHLGHASMLAIEDIMVRYHRMKGHRTLWLPGTDHAAIATQSKVEGILYKEEKKRRHDLGREEFLKRVEKYAQDSHDTIVTQVKQMGSSVDWSREAYTLDAARNRAVRTAFKQMYDEGLIYRKFKVVNWDPKGQTTVSDDEVDHTETTGTLYTFTYSKEFPIQIATTRPETKIGDTGVAVHPEDARYKQYIGKEFDITFAGSPIHIKVVGDEHVDPAFGTGAVGITPAHSMVDYEIATRHGLPLVQVINEYGKMMGDNPLLAGKKTIDARAAVVEWLKSEGLFIKEEAIAQNISTAERSGAVIEPLPKLQWFIDVNKPIPSRAGKTLKELMLEVVSPANISANNSVTFIPERFDKTYTNWITNLHDWCISRQIWYGHQIPVWYKTASDGTITDTYCGIEVPQGSDWTQDPDTLDTWFSSGLWTFSTLGWPDKTADLATYHPTTIIETGYDIIFFWVARMILMSTYLLGEVPFKTAYLHGLVRDAQGRKMSKTLGNGIDPLEMIAKYGADATRLSLIIGTGPGNDTRLSEDKIRAYKNFSNKLWNITRFILTSVDGVVYDANFNAWSATDTAHRTTQESLLAEITRELDEYKLYLVGEKLYHYTWHEFADKILEESKPILASGSMEDKTSRQQFLMHSLNLLLKTLHPFMPFVTEEIWGTLPWNTSNSLLIIEKWPK